MKLYEKLLFQPVSCGFEERLEEVEVREVIASQELIKAVEGLQETVNQLCSWMGAIAQKLGVAVPDSAIASG